MSILFPQNFISHVVSQSVLRLGGVFALYQDAVIYAYEEV